MHDIVTFHSQYLWPLQSLHRKFVHNDIPTRAYDAMVNVSKLIIVDGKYQLAKEWLENAYDEIAADLLLQLRVRTDIAAESGAMLPQQRTAFKDFVDKAEYFDVKDFSDFSSSFQAFIEAIEAYEAIKQPSFLLHGDKLLSQSLKNGLLNKSGYKARSLNHKTIRSYTRLTEDIFETKLFKNLIAYHLEFAKDSIYIPQPKNEIRNGLTHIIRGYSGDDACFENEQSRARGHFERAYLDCCKIAATVIDTLQVILESFIAYCRLKHISIPALLSPDYDKKADEELANFLNIYADDHTFSDKGDVTRQFLDYVKARYDLVVKPYDQFYSNPRLKKVFNEQFAKDPSAFNGPKIIDWLFSPKVP